MLFEYYSHSSSTLSSKTIGDILKMKSKNKCFCIHEIKWLIMMEMKMKMKNRSHRRDIKRPTSKHAYKHSTSKKCLSMIMVICIKEHLSNIWSSVHEEIEQHQGWVEKKLCLYRKNCVFYPVETNVPILYHWKTLKSLWFFDVFKGHRVSRSSCSQMFFKTGVLKNSAKFTGKHLRWSLVWIKLLV